MPFLNCLRINENTAFRRCVSLLAQSLLGKLDMTGKHKGDFMSPIRNTVWMICAVSLVFGRPSLASDEPVYPDTIEPNKPIRNEPVVVEELYVGQPTDACASVTCSGHGQCVIRQSYPVCACETGYLPDQTTGLHCLTPDQARNPSVGYVAPYAYERESRRQKQLAKRALVREARLATRNHPDFPGLRKKRRLGLAGTITGGVFMGIGGVMALAMMDSDEEFAIAGGVMMGVGFVMFLPGVIAAGSARRGINAIYRQEIESRRNHYELSLVGVTPMVSPDGRGAGIGATFRF